MKQVLAWVMSTLMAFTCLNINPSLATADNLVVNGSFEKPEINNPYFGSSLDWKSSLDGWKLSEANQGKKIEIQGGQLIKYPYDGKQVVEMDAERQVTEIYQDISTEAEKTYRLKFAFSPRPGEAENKLNVDWGDTTILKLEASGEGLSQTNWEVYNYGVKATSSQTCLSFDNLDEEPNGYGSYIDGVSLEPLICTLGDEDCKIIITPDETFILPVKITIPEDAGTLPLDLVLTQDLTSSFSDNLPKLKEIMPNFINGVRDIQPDTAFGLASFTDKKKYASSSSAEDYYVYKTQLPLTKNDDVFKQAIEESTIVGPGWDYPEASLSALMQVALRAETELGFRDNTRRIAIVSTDARYKQAGDYKKGKPNNGDTVIEETEDYPSVAQVKQAINNANLVPIFLVTSGYTDEYSDLVSELGVGAVVKQTSNSSNLLEAVKEALELVNQNLSVVAVNDDNDYVKSIDPDHLENVAPGSEVITNVTFKYSGRGTGDEVTIRALGIGDLVVDVKVVL